MCSALVETFCSKNEGKSLEHMKANYRDDRIRGSNRSVCLNGSHDIDSELGHDEENYLL